MLFINEWLPNPIGADAKGEFIELFNHSDSSVSLAGWALSVDGKKKVKISGSIRANSYLVLPRTETRIALKNADGKLFLYDTNGKLADESAFEGSAPEGQSFNRINKGSSGTIQNFVWGVPTPGKENGAVLETSITERIYPTDTSLNLGHLGLWSLWGLVLGVGVIFSMILWYATKNEDDLRDLFFGRDKRSWQRVC